MNPTFVSILTSREGLTRIKSISSLNKRNTCNAFIRLIPEKTKCMWANREQAMPTRNYKRVTQRGWNNRKYQLDYSSKTITAFAWEPNDFKFNKEIENAKEDLWKGIKEVHKPKDEKKKTDYAEWSPNFHVNQPFLTTASRMPQSRIGNLESISKEPAVSRSDIRRSWGLGNNLPNHLKS